MVSDLDPKNLKPMTSVGKLKTTLFILQDLRKIWEVAATGTSDICN